MARLTKKAMSQLQAHLAGLPRERLVELLMDQVVTDAGLRDRLLLEAAANGASLDVASFRRSIADAVRATGAARGGPPRTSAAWARRVSAAIDGIRRLAGAGHAAAVVELCEYALGRIQAAMDRVDDSSGYFRGFIADLESLHHAACLACRPDPVELARRLFTFEVDGGWDIFLDSVERYEDVLGEAGIGELRRLATERWEALPPAEPGGSGPRRKRPFHLSRMMDRLAVEAGDVDARVAVMAQDLSGYYHYAQIAQVLTDAGRPDEALVWAEKGLVATDLLGDHRDYDSRLDDFAIRAYLDRDRVDDALALLWRRFEARPDVSAYLRLRHWAGTVGAWDQWRTRARAHLRDDAARRAATPRSDAAAAASVRWRQPAPPPLYETLVAVLAADGDLDEAWALATEHGCSRHQWRELADARRATHPRDAITVYEREVDELLAARTNRSYPDAITRLATIRDLHHQAGDPDAFTAYLARIRHGHRAKTTFIRLLDEAGMG